jgi:hypothetical protein
MRSERIKLKETKKWGKEEDEFKVRMKVMPMMEKDDK